MAKPSVDTVNGWPMMAPIREKELALLNQNLIPGEEVCGVVIGNFNQIVVATSHKLVVVKTGMMAGQAFGGKATSFDYRNIGAVEVRTGFSQGELEIINPSLGGSQGNRNRDKVKIAESPNGIVFAKPMAGVMQEFAGKVRELVGAAHGHGYGGPAAAPAGDSIPEQIRKLSDLHAAGILTVEEFSTKKAELLARM